MPKQIKKKLNILVVGAGMYVTGRGTPGYGTIMPAVFEAARIGAVGRVGVVARTETSRHKAEERTDLLSEFMGLDILPSFFTKDMSNDEQLHQAVDAFKPDAAVISVPDHLHAKIAIPLVSEGIHCLVVKPMATTYEEAKAMAKAAKTAGVVAQVEFHKRLDESNRLLRDRIESGDLGEILYAVIEYSQQKRIPRDIFRAWAGKTNVFQYLGIHYVDLLQYATGFVPLTVVAWGQKAYLAGLGIDTWDSIQVVVSWEKPNGKTFISTHITNWIDPDETSAMSDQKINVVGTLGRFQADQKNRGVQVVVDGRGIADVNPYFSMAYRKEETGRACYKGYGIESVVRFFDDVVGVVEGRLKVGDLEKIRPSFEICKVSTAVVEAATKSLKSGNKIVEVNL